MSLFGNDEEVFNDYDEFSPEHLPEPGKFLRGNNILEEDAHTNFHELTRDIFEERRVYDMTFNYNLARLNLDTRHSDAGYRYAEEEGEPTVLRAEFTPTTEFCPQSHTLAIGSFRAWNGMSERHSYDLVRARVAEYHHNSDEINEKLRQIEEKYDRSGSVDVATSAVNTVDKLQ